MSAELRDELHEILKDLGEQIGAAAAWIGPADAVEDPPVRDLGRGKALFLTFAAGRDAESPEAAEVVEQAARSLRAAGRRWETETLPDVSWSVSDRPTHERVLARIVAYLQALANTERCDNILLTRDSILVAAASPPTELQRERIAFAVRQVAADASRRDGTSHGEIVGEDLYVRSFYVDAALIGFFSGPWATDFVRHRARRLVPELSHLLGMLDEPPPTEVATAPIPE